MFKNIIALLNNFSLEMRKRNISSYAAAAAFFFFLALFPLIMVACSFLPMTTLDEADLIGAISYLFPPTLDTFVVGLVESIYSVRAGVISFAVVMALWSASKAMLALIRGFNAILEVEELRNIVVLRAISLFYMLIFVAAATVMLVLEVFYRRIIFILEEKIPVLVDIASHINVIRYLLVWLIMTLVLALIYKFVPSKKLKYRRQLYGAAVAALGMAICSWGFSIYVNYGNFDIYGSLAIIVVLMLWLYAIVNVIMFGMYINAYLHIFRKAMRRAKANKISGGEE